MLPCYFKRNHYTQVDSVTSHHYVWFRHKQNVSDAYNFPYLIIPEMILCYCLQEQSKHKHKGLSFKRVIFEL